MLNYLKANRNPIRFRLQEAPLIILPDWDSSSKANAFKSVCDDTSIYRVMTWPDSSFNPKLAKCFRGIERHMSDRIIDEANQSAQVLGTKPDGQWTVTPEDYNKKFKPAVNQVVENGITYEDLIYVKDFIERLIQEAERIV